ncbi:MAG: hypothetical protein KDJ44_19745 [Rhodoblastus sp.]|nr:hypothetical protein [Rhodoblastus sp.]
MFFFLKSAFWLSLVFYCMSWPGGERPENLARQVAGHAAGEVVQRAQTAALEAAISSCKADPAGCLALAGVPARNQSAGRTLLRGSIAN